MSQTQINAAHRKMRTVSYKGLKPHEKLVVKYNEELTQLDKSISNSYKIGKTKYGDGFRQDERFLDTFDLIFKWESRKEKIRNTISKLELKYKCSEDSILALCNKLNRGRGYGGSF